MRRAGGGTCNHSARPSEHSGIVTIVQKTQGIKIRGRGQHLKKGKQGFIKHHMAGNDDLVGVKVETSITLVIRGVAKEDT